MTSLPLSCAHRLIEDALERARAEIDEGDISGLSESELILRGYGLTTAEFFYGYPDHPRVLTSLTWQMYDLAPDHPRLLRFIDFWKSCLDGPLHGVRYVHHSLPGSRSWTHVTGEFPV
mgnify:FL=1